MTCIQRRAAFPRCNASGAEDFKIVSAPLADPRRDNWVDEVPHRRGRMIVAVMMFKDYLVWLEREDGIAAHRRRVIWRAVRITPSPSPKRPIARHRGRATNSTAIFCASPIRR